MGSLDNAFALALDRIERRGQRRTLVPATIQPGGRLVREGRSFLDFSSNDYLGLARHPLLVDRAQEWTARLGAGSGASRLVTGTTEAHLALEAKIAHFKGTEAALLFASGWQANAAVLPALFAATPSPAVFSDKLIHASMHQGCATAGIRQHRFRHNDLDHLETLLTQRGQAASARFILTESVFSMDGDRADLPRLTEIACRHDAFLFVDEAHATGVLGPTGAGLSATVPGGVDLVMGTFSKAMGSFGAYVAGSKLLCDYLVNSCGGFIFSTAPPPAVLGAIDAALDLVPGMDAERIHLAATAQTLRNHLAAMGFDTSGSTTQIVPVIIGEAEAALTASQLLADRSIAAAAIRPPTVPAGTSRLRIACRAVHHADDMDQLLDALAACR